MLKIKDVLERMLLENPFLEDSLANGYLNASAFAQYVRPRIETETKKEVTEASIKMALSRLSRPMRKTPEKLFEASHFFLRKDISIVNLEKTPENRILVNRAHEAADRFPSEYVAVIEGANELEVVYGKSLSEAFESGIPRDRIRLRMTGLSLIGTHLDEKTLLTPGLFYAVSKRLYFYGINVVQVISTYRELAIVVDEKDARRALEVLVG